MLNIIKNTINRVFASGVDSDASAFITATGLSGTTQKSAITTLVKDLKSSGLWSKMKAVYPMVTDNVNQFSYSEDFSNAVWVPVNITITTNTATSPTGTNNADSFISTATTNPHPLVFVKTLSGTYTYSIYVKKNNSRYVSIKNVGGSANWAAAIYDLDNVVVTKTDFSTQTSVSANIQDVGNGWRRISITSTGNFTDFAIQYAPNGTSSFATYGDIVSTGTGATDYYIWGAQLEASSTASTYQPILTTPAAFMASQMKYNLKDARDLDAAFRLTWSGGWTYSATGATPNGTNAYADTKLNLASTLTQNDTHMSYYSRTNIIAANVEMGAYENTPANIGTYLLYNFSGTAYKAFNSLETTRGSTYNPTTGILIGSRINSSTEKYYYRGALVDTLSVVSQPLVPRNVFIGAFSQNGSPNQYSSKQTAFATIGNGLTDQDSQLLNQIVEKYQVALSRGVQAAQSFYYNSAYSNEANTYLYSTQITGTTQVSAINTLINGLKANNLWAKMKAVYPFVTDKTLQADMAAQMKFNLVNPQDSDAAFRLAFSGGWTYSTNGAQPNGTNGYADTKLGQTAAGMFANSHLSFYSRTNSTTATAQVEMGVGATVAGTFTNLLMRLDTSTNYIGGSVGSRNALSTSANSNGYVIVNALTAAAKAFKNGVLIATDTATQTGTLNALPIYIGCQNNNSVAGAFSSRQTAFATIGDGLSDAEAALLYQLVQEYQTTLSRQV